jgi:hypothetical protein
MTRTAERVDAVALMRSIRDRLSKDFAGLSFEEQHQRIRERLQKREPSKRRSAPAARKTTGHRRVS